MKKSQSFPLELVSAVVSVRDSLRGDVHASLQRIIGLLPPLHPHRKALADVAERVGAAADRLKAALKARERRDARPQARYARPGAVSVTSCHQNGANRGMLRPPAPGVRL